MDARARAQPQTAEHLVIGERVRNGGVHPFEEQKESVRAVDFTAAMRGKQITCVTIVLRPEPCCVGIPKPFHQQRAINDVGEEQRVSRHRTLRP